MGNNHSEVIYLNNLADTANVQISKVSTVFLL